MDRSQYLQGSGGNQWLLDAQTVWLIDQALQSDSGHHITFPRVCQDNSGTKQQAFKWEFFVADTIPYQELYDTLFNPQELAVELFSPQKSTFKQKHLCNLLKSCSCYEHLRIDYQVSVPFGLGYTQRSTIQPVPKKFTISAVLQ